jgi:hypothetical protein
LLAVFFNSVYIGNRNRKYYCLKVYEIAVNTRDFSHEMNRLRIGRGLCVVNYPAYD